MYLQKLIPTFKICEPKKHINGSHIVGLFEVVQSLCKYVGVILAVTSYQNN